MDRTNDTVSVSGAARALNCSPSWIRLLCERGELEASMSPLGRLIPRSSLEAYRDRQAAKHANIPA